ncbi:MAG TPA: prolyl oligopeptidase family serine peptidase, partial [Bacteroidota bacterium]|nr:prolyl oligopeptidase family serine peptidase [Bacteroidota bacterium]
ARKESSTRTDLYSVKLDGSGLRRLTSGPYTHTVKASPSGKYFISTYSNVSTPPRMSIFTGEGRLVRDLGDAKTAEFDKYAIARTELFTIQTPDGYALPVEWTLPLDFDRSKKYPVLISVYGGPNSPTVSDTWKGMANQWLAMEGLITMSIDHRGSGHFGKKGTALMKNCLGKWEMHDYEEGVKWLRTTGFVDTTKICITGGSYGGYVTCLALTEGADYFTHGVALFSVTDWILYDSHYTERYMGLPSENTQGYKDASPLSYADKYKGVIRIVHGTLDDNVHMQNSLQLVSKLEDLGKHFELMIYPEQRHGWGGVKSTHLQNETYRFYYRYLLEKPFPEKLFEKASIPSRRRR